jgi:hypothetical protein
MSFLYTNNFNSDIKVNAITVGRGPQNNSFSTSFGYQALNNSTSPATANTAIGFAALVNCLGGQNNIAVGTFAGSGITSGNYNLVIGQGGALGPPVFSVTTESNRIALGTTFATNAYVQVAWTVVSDARDKTEIKPLDRGLDFVEQLRPVVYRFKKDRERDHGHGPVRAGFLAQDIVPLEETPLVIDREDPEKLKLQTDALVPILVRAIQNLSARIKDLEARCNATV